MRASIANLLILFRRIWSLLAEYLTASRSGLAEYGDDEYVGFGRYRILHIKRSNRLKYISIYRFPNNHGAVVSMGGDTILDPIEIIPIRFVTELWYFEVESEPEYIEYFWDWYYYAYKKFLARLKQIRNQPEKSIEHWFDYEQRVAKDQRMYPLKWVQKNWSLQSVMRHHSSA